MPLDGSDVASKPSGTTAVALTAIESAKFNSVIDDIYAIQNTVRPLTHGHTGASTAIGAWNNISALGSNVTSASTTNLTTATGPFVQITGTTTITAITLATGTWRIVRATGALPMTASSSLVVNEQTSGTYTAVAGELFLIINIAGTVIVWTIGYNAVPFHTLRTLTDPNADRLAFWDDSAGKFDWLTPGTGLAISGTTMNAAVTHGTPVATTSGSTASWSSIPAGVNRIVIVFGTVSTNGTGVPLIQIGDGGGIENSGYVGAVSILTNAAAVVVGNHSSGFALSTSWAAGAIVSGVLELVRYTPGQHVWAISGSLGRYDSTAIHTISGVKALSAELDRVQLITTDTFDGGVMNVFYSY